MILTLLLVVLTLIISGNTASTNDSHHYLAAVVEYHPNLGSNPLESIQNNLPIYEDIIKLISQYNVDILVFPEGGFTGVVLPSDRKEIRSLLIEIPSPESKTIPCVTQFNSMVLNKLSCAARFHRMYVVVNLSEIVYCNTKDDAFCPEDSAYFYNTNVVFDREGRIIARYRKFNLYGEKGFDQTLSPELCTFDTDFGVRFGMFICFDILFQDPAARLIKEAGVKDVIFTTAWFSALPLLTASTVQTGWAYTNDVNLIAACYNAPAICGGGSGIYAGQDGPLVIFVPDRPTTQILLSKVLKKQYHGDKSQSKKCTIDNSYLTFETDHLVIPYREETYPPKSDTHSDLRFFADSSFKNFHQAILRSTDPDAARHDTLTASFAYEQDGFECTVTVSWRNKNNNATTDFNMFAYSGPRTFGRSMETYIETCGLTSYKPPPPTNPWKRFMRYDPPNDLATITSIAIAARTPDVGPLPIPVTLDTRSYPLANDFYTFSKRTVTVDERTLIEINMELSKPVDNLITFGIYKLPFVDKTITKK